MKVYFEEISGSKRNAKKEVLINGIKRKKYYFYRVTLRLYVLLKN